MPAEFEADSSWRSQRADEFLDRGPRGVLQILANRERGEHHGQMRFDGVAFAVEDRPGP